MSMEVARRIIALEDSVAALDVRVIREIARLEKRVAALEAKPKPQEKRPG